MRSIFPSAGAAGHPEFEHYATRSLRRLWAMRTPLGLFGTSLDMAAAAWLEPNGGIGASQDSFFEYMLKAYVLFGTLLKSFPGSCSPYLMLLAIALSGATQPPFDNRAACADPPLSGFSTTN